MRCYLLSWARRTALVVFRGLTVALFLVRPSGDPVRLFLPVDIHANDLNEFRQRPGFSELGTGRRSVRAGEGLREIP